MTTQDVYVALDELHGYVQRHVTAGYLTPDEITRYACEVYADAIDPAVLRHHAARYTREAVAERRAEQVAWPSVTDNDRLDAAFAALERDGIVSRQHFSCCGTCGAAEIWDEIAATAEAGLPAIGYTFFHMQDTESAVEGEGLYLSYGAVAEGAESTEAIGRAVVMALEAKGLTTVWDGHWSRRIFVQLDWQRRAG